MLDIDSFLRRQFTIFIYFGFSLSLCDAQSFLLYSSSDRSSDCLPYDWLTSSVSFFTYHQIGILVLYTYQATVFWWYCSLSVKRVPLFFTCRYSIFPLSSLPFIVHYLIVQSAAVYAVLWCLLFAFPIDVKTKEKGKRHLVLFFRHLVRSTLEQMIPNASK